MECFYSISYQWFIWYRTLVLNMLIKIDKKAVFDIVFCFFIGSCVTRTINTNYLSNKGVIIASSKFAFVIQQWFTNIGSRQPYVTVANKNSFVQRICILLTYIVLILFKYVESQQHWLLFMLNRLSRVSM